ncbi:MAG TPA: HAD hydrolase-like protein [Thermodesulfobacteriota bacterium]|jgi:phosphoglycolate phosphatase-like HAD superfamily hydrolase
MKLLLFDIDGTLILTGGAGTWAVNRAFEKIYGIRNAMDGVRPEGKTDPAILSEIFHKTLGRNPLAEEVNTIFKDYIIFLRDAVVVSQGYSVMPGINNLILALSKRDDLIQGIATGNIAEGAWIKLERAGLNSYFKFGGYGSDSEDREELIRISIERGKRLINHGGEGEKVFVIGDTPLDIIHGKAVGANTVAVATGSYSVSDLDKYEPHCVFENFLDFESVLNIFD